MCTISLNGSRPTFAPGGSIAFNLETNRYIYSPEELHAQLTDGAEVAYVAVWPSCATRFRGESKGVIAMGRPAERRGTIKTPSRS